MEYPKISRSESKGFRSRKVIIEYDYGFYSYSIIKTVEIVGLPPQLYLKTTYERRSKGATTLIKEELRFAPRGPWNSAFTEKDLYAMEM